MKKGELVEGRITEVRYPNRGVLSFEGEQIIVKNALPGQLVRARINKKKGGRIEAQLLSVLEPSPAEREAGCKNVPDCGGCLYQTLPYEEQLRIKEAQVRALLKEAAGGAYADVVAGKAWEGIEPSPEPFAYRNKMEYAFGDAEKDGPLTLGLHRRNSMYDVLTADGCMLVHEDFNQIVRTVLSVFFGTGVHYYHKRTHEGWLRHLLVRRAQATGEILVDLVTTSDGPDQETAAGLIGEMTEQLKSLALEGQIVGILHTQNDALSDIIRDDGTALLYGRDCFFEELLGLRFRITPFSFFQTNSRGAEVLYEKARSYLGNVEGRTVFDLYSGTGTIAQILAPVAREVVGVEIVEEAVQAARDNAGENGLSNCRFHAGDVLKTLDELPEKPDVIVLDPPRDGVHPKALQKILAYGVEKIVYISCKPTSLARDLAAFKEAGYQMQRGGCVDMFPHTSHVETVVLMSRAKD